MYYIKLAVSDSLYKMVVERRKTQLWNLMPEDLILEFE